ncbi:hypothetical protein D779_1702 [Imhoffiella purpurea]|uniref:Uncharacterized protein n=1 Tax=Imhoffiella purpurea TaxID=1249627 RepID=W9V6F7_9GAMM|nr:hypothetical protein D779_1702 [Imhoffiella purpurea]
MRIGIFRLLRANINMSVAPDRHGDSGDERPDHVAHAGI